VPSVVKPVLTPKRKGRHIQQQPYP
jgi:hypothetical protein